MEIKVGSEVMVVGSHYATGEKISSFIKEGIQTIQQVKSDRALISKNIGWVYLKDLALVKESNLVDMNKFNGRYKKVFIDAGHGEKDSGALGNVLKEKDIALSIAKELGEELTANGVLVEYSRKSDLFLELSERADNANIWGADLFVSIHCNSHESNASGTECYTSPNTNGTTKKLSKNISSSISLNLNLTNRGHKEANFTVLKDTDMPAILIETAFISNNEDAVKLKEKSNIFASTIANEILTIA